MKSSAFWAALGVAVLSLGVVPSSRADSHQEELRERTAVLIEHAYERDRILRDFDLDADAEGGRTGYIELEGRVRTQAQRTRAVSIAKRIAPRYRLVNRIEVRR